MIGVKIVTKGKENLFPDEISKKNFKGRQGKKVRDNKPKKLKNNQ